MPRSLALDRLLIGLAKTLHLPRVDPLGHAIKVDEKTQEDLVGSGAVLLYAAEIAQNGDAGHVLAVKGQYA